MTLDVKDLFFALLGAVCFSIIYRVPRRFFFITVSLAICARLILSLWPNESQLGLVTFSVSFTIGILSHTIGRITGAPSQAFLVPGVVFLVPGIYIYKAFDAGFNNRIMEALQHMISILSIGAGISFALLLANWLFPPRKQL